MPRAVRTLLFGQSHSEVDLKGSFYELVRRLGMQYAPDHLPLPTIDELRAILARDPYIQAVEEACPNTIKRLPLRVINSTPESAFRSFPSIIEGSPNATTQAIMRQLWLQLGSNRSTATLPQTSLSHGSSRQHFSPPGAPGSTNC